MNRRTLNPDKFNRPLSRRGEITGKPGNFVLASALIGLGSKAIGTAIGAGVGKNAKEDMNQDIADNKREQSLAYADQKEMQNTQDSRIALQGYNPQGDAQMYARKGASIYYQGGGHGQIQPGETEPLSGELIDQLLGITYSKGVSLDPEADKRQAEFQKRRDENLTFTDIPGTEASPSTRKYSKGKLNKFYSPRMGKVGDTDLQEVYLQAAQASGVDPTEFAAAMNQENWNSEAMQGTLDQDASIDSYSYGLDTVGNYSDIIEKKLGKDYSRDSYELYQGVNDRAGKAQAVQSAKFKDVQRMGDTAAAIYKYRSEVAGQTAKDLGIELTPKQRQYFNYMAYNTQHNAPNAVIKGGENKGTYNSSLKLMMKDFKKRGLLDKTGKEWDKAVNTRDSKEKKDASLNPYPEGTQRALLFDNAGEGYRRIAKLKGAYVDEGESDTPYARAPKKNYEDEPGFVGPPSAERGASIYKGSRGIVPPIDYSDLNGRGYQEGGSYKPYPYQDQPRTMINPTLMYNKKNYYHGGISDNMGMQAAHPFGPIGVPGYQKGGKTTLSMVQNQDPALYWPQNNFNNLNNPGNVGRHRDNMDQRYPGSSQNFQGGGVMPEGGGVVPGIIDPNSNVPRNFQNQFPNNDIYPGRNFNMPDPRDESTVPPIGMPTDKTPIPQGWKKQTIPPFYQPSETFSPDRNKGIEFKGGGTLLQRVQTGNTRNYWPSLQNPLAANNPGNVRTHRDNADMRYPGSSDNFQGGGEARKEGHMPGDPNAIAPWYKEMYYDAQELPADIGNFLSQNYNQEGLAPLDTVRSREDQATITQTPEQVQRQKAIPNQYQDGGTMYDQLQGVNLNQYQQFQQGGALPPMEEDAQQVPGGQLEQVSDRGQVVKGDNPELIDDVELGTNPGEPDAVVDDNEVIIDAVDEQGQPYKQIFSDTVLVPGENKSMAKKAKSYLNQMPEDESSEQAQLLYKKLDELFEVQQMMNGDSHGENAEEAAAGGMDPGAAQQMEGQGAFQGGGRTGVVPDPQVGGLTDFRQDLLAGNAYQGGGYVGPSQNTPDGLSGQETNLWQGLQQNMGQPSPDQPNYGGMYQDGGMGYPSAGYDAALREQQMQVPYPRKNYQKGGIGVAEGILTGVEGAVSGFGPGMAMGAGFTKDYYGNTNPALAASGTIGATSGLAQSAGEYASEVNSAEYQAQKARNDKDKSAKKTQKALDKSGAAIQGTTTNPALGVNQEQLNSSANAALNRMSGNEQQYYGYTSPGGNQNGGMVYQDGGMSYAGGGMGYNNGGMMVMVVEAQPVGTTLADLQSYSKPENWGNFDEKNDRRRTSVDMGRTHRPTFHDTTPVISGSERGGPTPKKKSFRGGGRLYYNTLSKRSLTLAIQ